MRCGSITGAKCGYRNCARDSAYKFSIFRWRKSWTWSGCAKNARNSATAYGKNLDRASTVRESAHSLTVLARGPTAVLGPILRTVEDARDFDRLVTSPGKPQYRVVGGRPVPDVRPRGY